MGSRLCAPILRDALFFSHFQPHEVYKHPGSSQIIQSRVCCLLNTTSTRPAFTSTSAASGCSIPRPRFRSSVTLYMSTKRTEDYHSHVKFTSKIVLAKRTSDFHSQVNSRCASKCTSNFHLQVNCTSKIVLAKRTSDFHSQVNTNVLSKCTPKNVLPKWQCAVAHCHMLPHCPSLGSGHLGTQYHLTFTFLLL